MYGRQKVFDSLLRNLSTIKSAMTLDWKAVGVKGYERIFSPMFLERIVESQETREIGGICDQGGPDFGLVKACFPR